MHIDVRGFALLAAMALSAPAVAGQTIQVKIDQLTFIPAKISAHVGDTVEWTNNDFVAHTATAKNKAWDIVIPANGVGRVTLAHPGEIDYFCRFHPNMTGEIVVSP